VRRNLFRIGVIALAGLAAEADTVTTRDSRSWNGIVTSIKNGMLELQATFPNNQTRTLQIGGSYIRSIEFNPTTYNAGDIPTMPPQQNGGQLFWTIYLQQIKGQKPQEAPTCMDISVDPQTVGCDGTMYPRKRVVRILIGTE
jgi:hypothetical protein